MVFSKMSQNDLVLINEADVLFAIICNPVVSLYVQIV